MKPFTPDQPILLNHNRVKRAYTGGKLLDQWQGIEPAVDSNMSEEWLVATVDVTNIDKSAGEGQSTTTDEDGRTVSLLEIIGSDPKGFLGEKHYSRYGSQIGVLARAGDTNVRLVIQTHPDKESARKYLNYDYGKSEAWYILNCRNIGGEIPHIYAGFKPGLTREIWESLFEKQDIQGMLDKMHKIPVKKGDVMFIAASLPHTIGPGILFLELHEPSDYILRLEKQYLDIGAFADDDLHCGMGFKNLFDCFDYRTYTDDEIRAHIMAHPKIIREEDGYREYSLLTHERTGCFAVNKAIVKGKFILDNHTGHCIVVVVNGSGRIDAGRLQRDIRKGQGIFVPAGLERLTFEPKADALEIVIGYPPKIGD